jgi:hypothetical protein
MVDLVALAGDRIVSGMNSLVDGRLDQQRDAALERAREQEFGGV